VASLNAAAVKALDDEIVRKRLLELGSVNPHPCGTDAGGARYPREVESGAQAGKLGSTIKPIGERRDASSAPCRLRRECPVFRV